MCEKIILFCCGEKREATEEEKIKDKQKVKEIEKRKLNESNTSVNTFSMITNDSIYDDIKLEDYYFRRPVENKYSNNELYSMDIEEIYLGIHPTIYKKDKKDNQYEKSFHPFFFWDCRMKKMNLLEL